MIDRKFDRKFYSIIFINSSTTVRIDNDLIEGDQVNQF